MQQNVNKPKISRREFKNDLRDAIKKRPAIKSSNYEEIREELGTKYGLSKRGFDEIFGYLMSTDEEMNMGVWVFTSGSQVKTYHTNVDWLKPFDSIDFKGKGL